MEINKEALNSLSLADVCALSDWCDKTLNTFSERHPAHIAAKQMILPLETEIKNRIDNIFIF